MKSTLFGPVVGLITGLALAGSVQAAPHATAPRPATPQAAAAKPEAGAKSENAAKKPAAHHKRHTAAAAESIPSGAGNCVDRLIKLASTEPMTAYDKGPDKIINDGLLWNDPKSKCSVGADSGLRDKVAQIATDWQQKNADKVKSELQDLKSAVPASSAETAAAKPKRHHTAAKKPANKNAAK